jgi:hypothetical protein
VSATDPKSKAQAANAPAFAAAPLRDVFAGFRWGAREALVAALVLLVVDVFAGWTYLASYFAYFRIPVESLGLGVTEVLGQGLRTVLLPLTVIVAAAVAPGRLLRPAALAVGVYLLVLAAAALAIHWASPGAVLVQLVSAVVAAAIVFGLRLGAFGTKPTERLMIGAAGLVLLISVPVASATLDAGQVAGAKTTTLRLVTSGPLLPSAVPAGGQYDYNNYVLLRENDSRYWLFRIGDHYAYSIAKTEVLYIRY